MMFELTGVLNFILPTILTVTVAKFVAKLVSGDDGHANLFIQMKGYPYMDTREDYHFVATVDDIMTTTDRLVVFHNGMTIAHVQVCMNSVPFNTFLVIDHPSTMNLEGCITRADLQKALRMISMYHRETTHAIVEATQVLNPASAQIYFHEPLPDSRNGVEAVDASPFTNQTPLTLPCKTTLSLAHQLFTKIGVRYLPILECGGAAPGQLAGLVTKKDMVAHANAALGALAEIAHHRVEAHELRQRYIRARQAASRAWHAGIY